MTNLVIDTLVDNSKDIFGYLIEGSFYNSISVKDTQCCTAESVRQTQNLFIKLKHGTFSWLPLPTTLFFYLRTLTPTIAANN